VCDHAREACPYFPHARANVHWGMEDPAAVTGTDEEKLAAFRETVRVLEGRVGVLLALPVETMSEVGLTTEARAIGARRF